MDDDNSTGDIFDQVRSEVAAHALVSDRLHLVRRQLEHALGEPRLLLMRRTGDSSATTSDQAAAINRRLLEQVSAASREFFAGMRATIPQGRFFAYGALVRRSIRELVSITQLLYYSLERRFVLPDEMTRLLDPEADGAADLADVHLDFEDYIGGLIQVASDLNALALDAAIGGDAATVERIADFISSLMRGQQLLNFKNSDLRRAFDSLKYENANASRLYGEVRQRLQRDEATRT